MVLGGWSMECANGGCLDTGFATPILRSNNSNISPVAELCKNYHVEQYA